MPWPATWVLPGGSAALPGGRPAARAGIGKRAEHHRGTRGAKAQGIEVKDRGRVPAELVVKFKAATGQ